MSNYFKNILPKFQCGFRQVLRAQYCLMSMVKKRKKFVDKGKKFAILLSDLLKDFYRLSHDLQIAKRNAYGFSFLEPRLIYSYMSGRRQETKLNNWYSS